MKKVLLLALGVVLAANVAFADHIGIYTDPAGNGCTLTPSAAFVPLNTYVIHKFTAGTTGSRFKVVDTTTLFQAGTATPYALGGAAYTGASIAYGSCLVGSVNAMTLTHIWFNSPAPACGKLEIVPDPLVAQGTVLVTDCGFVELSATGGQMFYFPNGTCSNCNEVATEATTWGTIKALYR